MFDHVSTKQTIQVRAMNFYANIFQALWEKKVDRQYETVIMPSPSSGSYRDSY